MARPPTAVPEMSLLVEPEAAPEGTEPWLTDEQVRALEVLEDTASGRDPDYERQRWRWFRRARGAALQDLLDRLSAGDLLDLQRWDPSFVHATGFGPLSIQDAPTASHLEAVDYAWARSQPGSTGRGIELGVLELGWCLDHPDLAGVRATVLGGNPGWTKSHGVRTLGVLAGCENAEQGTVGLVPDASLFLSSPRVDEDEVNIAGGVFRLLSDRPGRVILVEAAARGSLAGGRSSQMPVEVIPVVRSLFRLAAALGSVVIEPAGNGTGDLGALVLAGGQRPFAAGTPDSRALMVGGMLPGDPTTRVGWTGKRVDAVGHAAAVRTTDWRPGDADTDSGPRYTGGFDGTSAASAIFAGCVALAASIRAERGAPRRSAAEWRAHLRHGNGGVKYPGPPRISALVE